MVEGHNPPNDLENRQENICIEAEQLHVVDL